MTLRIRRPDDFHVHLRNGDLLREVVRYTALQFGRGLAMPNLRPKPVLTAQDAVAYKAELTEACRGADCPDFEPLMTIQITDKTTPEMIREARAAGVVAGKVYPLHGTTNSDNGVSDISGPRAVYRAMQEVGMVLCVHAEAPGAFILDREKLCVNKMLALANDFPRLRIVWEHISCVAAAMAVRDGPSNLYATITAHHLVLTLDDVVGRSHHHCMPVVKTPLDRKTLVDMAVSGNPKFFFGSDSAPHPIRNKECEQAAAGIFSAPVALPVLAKVFAERQALDRLEAFTSEYGARCYNLPLNDGFIELVPDDRSCMPRGYGPSNTVRPFMLGEKIGWEARAID